MEETKKNKVILIVIMILIVLGFCGYIVYKIYKSNFKEDFEYNSNMVDKNNDKFSIDLLKGVWGSCKLNESNNKVCYLKQIKDNNGTYILEEVMYQGGGRLLSEITKYTKIGETKYELEKHRDAFDGDGHSYAEETSNVIVDVSAIKNKIIYIDGFKYEYITNSLANSEVISNYFEGRNQGNNENILKYLEGVWGSCKLNESNNKVCYIFSITKQNNDNYFNYGMYQTDGGIFGVIKDVKKNNDNKYELEIFSNGCTGSDCIEQTEDKTFNVVIEFNSEKNSIIYENNEYKFIAAESENNWDKIDTFFNEFKF